VGEPWSQSCHIYLTASDLQVGQPSDLAKNCMAHRARRKQVRGEKGSCLSLQMMGVRGCIYITAYDGSGPKKACSGPWQLLHKETRRTWEIPCVRANLGYYIMHVKRDDGHIQSVSTCLYISCSV
jgi:hypothetical protein